jgi:hypothetical protein
MPGKGPPPPPKGMNKSPRRPPPTSLKGPAPLPKPSGGGIDRAARIRKATLTSGGVPLGGFPPPPPEAAGVLAGLEGIELWRQRRNTNTLHSGPTGYAHHANTHTYATPCLHGKRTHIRNTLPARQAPSPVQCRIRARPRIHPLLLMYRCTPGEGGGGG